MNRTPVKVASIRTKLAGPDENLVRDKTISKRRWKVSGRGGLGERVRGVVEPGNSVRFTLNREEKPHPNHIALVHLN